MKKIKKLSLVFIALVVLTFLAVPVLADEERDLFEPFVFKFLELIGLVLIAISVILFVIIATKITTGDLSKASWLSAIALVIYGPVREALEIGGESFGLSGGGLYSEIAEVIGAVLILIAVYVFYSLISSMKEEISLNKKT